MRIRPLAGPVLVLLVSLAAHGQVWIEQGPGPKTDGQSEGISQGEVSGAVQTIAIHPTDVNTIYIGAVNGGIWKTTDATAQDPTWVPQLGLTQALSIGAVAFDPTDVSHNTLLAGCGRFSSFNRRGSARVGLWRTLNGGATWIPIGNNAVGLNIAAVAPRGTTLVLAANAADGKGKAGVWRSTDTGGFFKQISGEPGTGLPAGPAFDLAADPTRPAVLYTNGGPDGIFRSADTGATWQKVSTAAMDVLVKDANNVRIAVGDKHQVYVGIVVKSELAGLFRSPDGQTGWTALDLPKTLEANGLLIGIHAGPQGGTHFSIAADRRDANIVYVGGDRQPCRNEPLCTKPVFPNSLGAFEYSGRLFRVDASKPPNSQASSLTHSGTPFNSAPHADSRDMALDGNGDLIEADDGGIYRRRSPHTSSDWRSMAGNLRVNELHSVEWDPVSKIAFGGSQDNGVPEQNVPGNIRWRSIANADGGDVGDRAAGAVSFRYKSHQKLIKFRRRSYSAANVFQNELVPAFTIIGNGASPQFSFITPIAVNGVTPERLLFGAANSLYESLDDGASIREIGPGLATNEGPADPLAYGAAGNPDVIYAGVKDDVFIRIAPAPNAPVVSTKYPGRGTGRNVLDLVVHPQKPPTVFVVDREHVYRTATAGIQWSEITGNLQTLAPGTIRSITFSTANAEGRVIVGTDRAVFSATGPNFNNWSVLGTGLPRALVLDLVYAAADKTVAAALLGRGSWTLKLEGGQP